MDVKINGSSFQTLSQLQGHVSSELYAFLQDWFSPEPFVWGHTSGSTGIPQAIRLYKRDMQASAELTNRFFDISASSKLLLCLSPRYIAGKMMVVRALSAGAMLYEQPVSSLPLEGWSVPVDLAAMVPMQVASTLSKADGADRLSLISRLLIGGAPVDAALETRLAALPCESYATYGMTETVSHVALRRLGCTDAVYAALGDVTFSVDDRTCLVVHTPHLSGKRFVTNDMVRLIDDRHFIWSGRYDNVIISGGLKFSAEELERKIAPLLFRRYYVTAAPDEFLGQHIVLVIEGEPYDEVALQQLRAQLSGVLQRFEMPREIRFLSRFLETYSGKIRRVL